MGVHCSSVLICFFYVSKTASECNAPLSFIFIHVFLKKTKKNKKTKTKKKQIKPKNKNYSKPPMPGCKSWRKKCEHCYGLAVFAYWLVCSWRSPDWSGSFFLPIHQFFTS